MDIQIVLSDCTLSTEDQAVVEAVNEFLAWLPDDADPKPALRLAMAMLEAADVAPQDDLAQAAGYAQSQSLREYIRRLQEEGLSGLWDHPIPGRPAITTRTAVEKDLFQVVLDAVIEEHMLPDDDILAERVDRVLSEEQASEAGQVTGSMVETIRLRWEIKRPALAQRLQEAAQAEASEPEPTQLGRTRVGGAFILAVLLVETGWLKLAHLLPMAADYAVTATQWLLTAIFSVVYGIKRAFHLDDVRDIGFALLTGRGRPLTHGAFQHLRRAIPGEAAEEFYQASAELEVQSLDEGPRRISLDGHNLPRWTRAAASSWPSPMSHESISTRQQCATRPTWSNGRNWERKTSKKISSSSTSTPTCPPSSVLPIASPT